MPQESPSTTTCLNPATREILGQSVLNKEEEIGKLIEQARLAQPAWAAMTVKKRVQSLLRVRDYLVANTDRLADIVSRDNGKTRVDAIATEIVPAAMSLSYYCRHARRFLKEKRISAGNLLFINKRTKTIRVPYGVVGVISPWNYPFAIAFSEIVMGLLAGNAVIWKAASETQMVGLALKESIGAAGLPEHIFSYVNLPGKIAGKAFLKGGVDKLFFTGSVAVGKQIMAEASETLTPLVLELGGNDAMIVCEDADLWRAANGALWAGYSNSGQSCGSVERLYIHERIYDPFMAILKERIENMRVRYDFDYETDMGTMTTGRQIETVKRHVDDALAKGAILFAQSGVPQESVLHNFLPAMVLTNVNHQMELMQHETFGPVIGVMKFRSIDEAIELANDSYLGLTGSVWSKNIGRAEKIARRIKAGVVTINDHMMTHGLPETSWGGFKQSGIGRTHGEIGFGEFTQPQMIIADILPLIHKNMWWHPYSKKLYAGLSGLMEFLYGHGIVTRIKGVRKLLKIIPRMMQK